jgi:hypothetical protein
MDLVSEIRSVSYGTCSYICMYINTVVNSVMLHLQHDIYNTIFKTLITYSLRVSTPSPQLKILVVHLLITDSTFLSL